MSQLPPPSQEPLVPPLFPSSSSPPPPASNDQSDKKPGKRTLAGVIGISAASLLLVSIPHDEGVKYKAYRDIVGVWTVCDGDTKNVVPGLIETKAGCQARLENQLVIHAEPVMKCSPGLRQKGRDYQRAAAVSLAYNVGDGAFCHSSINRDFNQGKWVAGCNAFLLYDKAAGRVIPGLLARRTRERAVCLKGL